MGFAAARDDRGVENRGGAAIGSLEEPLEQAHVPVRCLQYGGATLFGRILPHIEANGPRCNATECIGTPVCVCLETIMPIPARALGAALLAAVRSAVLWRQLGGSYWDFVLRRGAMSRIARELLKQG